MRFFLLVILAIKFIKQYSHVKSSRLARLSKHQACSQSRVYS